MKTESKAELFCGTCCPGRKGVEEEHGEAAANL